MTFDLNEYRVRNAGRIGAGEAIDPANAEVSWSAQTMTLNCKQDKRARIYAARTPPKGPWIDFHELEDPIQTEMWNRLERGQMSPADGYLISVDDLTARAELIALRLQQKAARDALSRERIEAGKLIVPATAEMMWCYAETLDPYGDGFPDEPHVEEWSCVGRERFARAPGGIWVDFGDLPDETRKALWARKESKQLMFPNGLDFPDELFDPDVDLLKY